MGPIYGTMFSTMSKTMKKETMITKELMLKVLEHAITKLRDLAGAKLHDKTLLDPLYPAKEAFRIALKAGQSFAHALQALKKGVEEGKENTKKLVAKIGRAARLKERSRGYLDAGATSLQYHTTNNGG